MMSSFFKDLLKSVQEMDGIINGEITPSRVFEITEVDAKQTRFKTGLTQAEFAKILHVSPKTLQNWEQKRRKPSSSAVALLHLVNNAPDIVLPLLQTNLSIEKNA